MQDVFGNIDIGKSADVCFIYSLGGLYIFLATSLYISYIVYIYIIYSLNILYIVYV